MTYARARLETEAEKADLWYGHWITGWEFAVSRYWHYVVGLGGPFRTAHWEKRGSRRDLFVNNIYHPLDNACGD